MCDEQILQSLATRVPKIILQRVEEIFPPLKESLVSVLCLCDQKIFLSSCKFIILKVFSWDLHAQRK
jgi:hypothetical protein